jgi:LysM repeat protein
MVDRDERMVSENRYPATRRRIGEPSNGAGTRSAAGNGGSSASGRGSAGNARPSVSGSNRNSGSGQSSGNGGSSAGGNGLGSGNGRGSGNGSGSAASGPPELHGWQPVELTKRVARADTPKAPDMPPPFRRVYNGEPRYRGPSQVDPTYSPVHYHFARVRPGEIGGPSNMWLAVLVIVGLGLGVLFVAAIPSLLTHRGVDTVASPTPTLAASELNVLPVPTVTPFRILTPTPTPTPTPGPSFRTYKVQPGDTLTRIAEKFGLKTWELLAANPGLKNNPNNVVTGAVLNIPTHGQFTPSP